MSNFITLGSCLSYTIGNQYKKLKEAKCLSSTRHNRIDKLVDVYLEKSQEELSYQYLSNFEFDKNSQLDLKQQIDNQFLDKSLGKTSINPKYALGFTEMIENLGNIDLVIYDTFCDLLFKLLWSKDKQLSFFFNIKYSNNWQKYFDLESNRLEVKNALILYTKLVKYFKYGNPNIKIVFINFPVFHHKNPLAGERAEKLNQEFYKNKFLQENSFFIPAIPVEKRYMDSKNKNHFKKYNGNSIYLYYAKVIKAITDNNFDQAAWQEARTTEANTLVKKLNKIANVLIKKQETNMPTANENISATTTDVTQEHFARANELAQQGKYDEAIEMYKRSLNTETKDSDSKDFYKEVYLKIDKILSEQDRNKELISIYKQGIIKNPKNHWLYKRLGDIYYKQEKLDSAISCYDQAIEIDQNFAWSYKKMGDACDLKGREYLAKAYNNYQKAVEIKSSLNKNVATKVAQLSQVIASTDTESKPKDRNNYWNRRKDGLLYQMVKSLAAGYVPNGDSVLEVGCHTSSFIFELDWFKNKAVTDLPFLQDHWQGVEGVEFIPGDFYKLKFDRTFDLVLCTQVVEHLKDPKPFIQKLLSLGKTVIVSTTYEVPEGACKYHVQDPISLEKFQGWFERDFTAQVIMQKPDSKIWKNIIAVVKEDIED